MQALTGGQVDFALLAVGGVRAELPAGEWREGDSALTLLPFKNQLSVLTLTGAEVRALLSETITATLPPAPMPASSLWWQPALHLPGDRRWQSGHPDPIAAQDRKRRVAGSGG